MVRLPSFTGVLDGPTFRTRVAAEALCLAVVVATVASVVVYVGTLRALRMNLDNALLSIARTELSATIGAPEGRIHMHDEMPTLLDLTVGAGYEKFAQVEDEHDRILAQTNNLKTGTGLRTDPRQEAAARNGNPSFANIQCSGQPCRALYYPLPRPGKPAYLAIVAIPDAPVNRSLRSLVGVLLLAFALGASVGTWGAYTLGGRLTRPLQAIAAAARTVGEENLGERLPDVSPDRELRDVTAVLNQMLERLERAFEAQGTVLEGQRRFLADASHELRSPLASLRGTVEVALRRPRSADDYCETLAASLVEIERLCRLVDDLLTLSRADAGRFSFKFEPVDILEVVCRAVSVHAAVAERDGIRIVVDAPQKFTVRADRDRLRQVIDNLLDNAVHYSSFGSQVALRIRRERETVRVSVVDHGPGLTDEQRERVFDRFYRADRARARRSGGLGLGLTIVKALVEAHGGTVGVDSVAGEGATFWFTLPA